VKIARRPLLGLGMASSAALLSGGCRSLAQRLTKTPLPDAPLPPRAGAPALRVLNRVAYGPRPGDVARVQQMGLAAYIEEQLAPENIEEEPAAFWRVRRLNDVLRADPGLLFDQDDKRVVAALRAATTLRAVYSRRQLHERMVEFWTDHFNVYANKGQGAQLKVVDDRDTIRAHALGRFRDLLGASARSAAMLGYLDNTVNRRGVPNENYAREILELHTLGVDGGYTQRDVGEVARCLTGWTSERHWHRGRFQFNAARHDDGAKRLLETTIPPGGGVEDGERVLDRLAEHPATARHLAGKLCRYFLGESPEPVVTRLATTFRQTQGDIKAVLRSLLSGPELLAAPPILKRPFDYLVSALRALNADTDGGEPLQRHLAAMGQPLFGWPTPDGFPLAARAWTGSLIPRWNFALALAGSHLADTSVDWKALGEIGGHDALLELLFGTRAGDPALTDLRRCQPDHPDAREYAALLLMSPAFQWR
jgi:uncharacterized protein (DUF1800 family)